MLGKDDGSTLVISSVGVGLISLVQRARAFIDYTINIWYDPNIAELSPSQRCLVTKEIGDEMTTDPATTIPSDIISMLRHAGADVTRFTNAYAELTTVAEFWQPSHHLRRYIVRCRERGTTPVAEEWYRWLIDDDQRERTRAKALSERPAEEPQSEEERRRLTWNSEWCEG